MARSGITWPRISVGGEENLEVKYGFQITYKLSQAGIDTRKLGRIETTIATFIDVFAVCVEHNFKGTAPTADEWAAKLEEHEDDPDAASLRIASVVKEAFQLSRRKKDVPAAESPAPPATEIPAT